MRRNEILFLILFFFLSFSNLALCYSKEFLPVYRAIHVGGNWGVTQDLISLPDDYFMFLNRLNTNWVGISVALHIDDSMDSNVKRKYSGVQIPTFTDEALIALIRKFKVNGFKVYLTLAFESFEAENSDHPVFRWQLGDPKMATEDPRISAEFWPWSLSHPNHRQFVEQFWNSYSEQAIYFAKIAQQENVEMFSLGTETERLFRTRSGGYWPNDFGNELKTMVGNVRKIYSGTLTYDMSFSATLEDDFYSPGSDHLWSDLGLDIVGVSAYYELSETCPSYVMNVEDLEERWQEIFDKYLKPLKNRNPNLPIVFLEFGYTDSVQAPFKPSAEEYNTAVFTDNNDNGLDDGQETQANIYKAFFLKIEKNPNILQGAFLWGHSMTSDENWNNSFALLREFSVRKKLAENVVKKAYGAKNEYPNDIKLFFLNQKKYKKNF